MRAIELPRVDPDRATLRYVDAQGEIHIKLRPKEYYVSNQSICLTTVLGSCVAACLCDPIVGVGGMNHFMLADPPRPDGPRYRSMIYGGYAMQRLIDEMLARGARREHLEAKIFGAANVLTEIREARIGDANAVFIRQYLAKSGIATVAEDLGGDWPRQLRYYPTTGRVRMRRLRTVEPTLAERERAVANNVVTTSTTPVTVERQ